MLDMPMVFALYALVISCSMRSRAISYVNRFISKDVISFCIITFPLVGSSILITLNNPKLQ